MGYAPFYAHGLVKGSGIEMDQHHIIHCQLRRIGSSVQLICPVRHCFTSGDRIFLYLRKRFPQLIVPYIAFQLRTYSQAMYRYYMTYGQVVVFLASTAPIDSSSRFTETSLESAQTA